ncbi:MAG TPA: PQQ-binding-like beta-propeller repeat protein [Mycobacteriales bacterium]|nr:PQQ-binding-like beta-propeller repeat protein [Mycobacteriales bacterium]
MATGFEVVWRRVLHQRPNPQAFAVVGDVVLVVERSSRLVRVDERTGGTRWEARVGDTWGPLGCSGSSCCYVDERQGLLRNLDLADGHERWSSLLPRPGGYAVGAHRTVVTGGWRHYHPLTGFDLETGATRWSWRDEPAGPEPAASLRPLALGDDLLVGTPGGRVLWQLQAATGRVVRRWRLPLPLADPDAREAFARIGDRTALVRCGPRLVVRIDLDDPAPQTVWWHDSDLEPDAVQLLGGTMLLRETAGRTVAVDFDRGIVRWTLRSPEPAVADAVQVPGGYVLADRSGLVWLLDQDGETITRRPLSRRHHQLATGTEGRLFVLGKGELVCLTIGPG